MESAEQPTEAYFTFTGPIDGEAVKRILGVLSVATQRKAKKVHLLIHSEGGLIVDGLALHNILRNLPLELVTYNAGSVASIAVLVFLAGSTRVASASASFTIHKSTSTFPGPVTAETMASQIEAVKHNDAVIEAILHSYLKLPAEKWSIHAIRNLTLTAQESVEFALIHKIEDFRVPPGEQFFAI